MLDAKLTMNHNTPTEVRDIAERHDVDFSCWERNGRVLVFNCAGTTEYGNEVESSLWLSDSEIDDVDAWIEVFGDLADETYDTRDQEDLERWIERVGGEDYSYRYDDEELDETVEELEEWLDTIRAITDDLQVLREQLAA